jgi:membrane fusion protein (multidrug efflux system)
MNATVQTLQSTEIPAHPGPTPAASASMSRRPSRRTLVVGAAALAVAVAGAAYIAAPATSVSTDNAYVGADATAVAPKVRGLVAEVLVHDNQTVRAGDPLVRIDAEEFDARVATAHADLADADAGVAAAQAALLSLDAEERLAAANVHAAQTSIRSANAEQHRAITDSKRYEALVSTGAVSQHDADLHRAGAIAAEQDTSKTIALLDAARQAQGVTLSRRAMLSANLQKAQASVERARAALDLALQDQRHAVIVAPIDGVVGNRQAQRGDYVQPGSRLLTLVPLQDLYVTANFKETQTGRMTAGQKVTIRVDALPGQSFRGTVESFAPGSGSQFALLPFEPGTGNFTKIVQRVPVRIRFEANQTGLERLRPGLSVTAKVNLDS